MRLPKWLANQYVERAQAEREEGGSCVYDRLLPSIDIVMSNGDEYHYQEGQVDELLEEYPIPNNIITEDFLLAVFQNA